MRDISRLSGGTRTPARVTRPHECPQITSTLQSSRSVAFALGKQRWDFFSCLVGCACVCEAGMPYTRPPITAQGLGVFLTASSMKRQARFLRGVYEQESHVPGRSCNPRRSPNAIVHLRARGGGPSKMRRRPRHRLNSERVRAMPPAGRLASQLPLAPTGRNAAPISSSAPSRGRPRIA